MRPATLDLADCYQLADQIIAARTNLDAERCNRLLHQLGMHGYYGLLLVCCRWAHELLDAGHIGARAMLSVQCSPEHQAMLRAFTGGYGTGNPELALSRIDVMDRDQINRLTVYLSTAVAVARLCR